MRSSRKVNARSAPNSLHMPTSGGPSVPKDEAETKSHSIKEIVVDQRIANESGKPTVDPTPRRRGDGYHFFEEDENDENKHSRNRHPKAKRSMVDPPGFHDIIDVSRSKHKGRKDPETGASIHRRRKRVIEERARNIRTLSRETMKHHMPNMDGTEETASMSSQHSSWVPTRRIDKDPNNKPIGHYTIRNQMPRETMEIRDRAVPQRPWRPERQLSNKRSNLAEADDMDFSTTNEWVPSEFYKNRKQPQQAMHMFPTGIPHVLTSYQTHDNAQHHEHLLQQQRQREYLQHQIQLQQELEAQRNKSSGRPHRLAQQPPSIIHTITSSTTPSEPTTDNPLSLINTTTTATTPEIYAAASSGDSYTMSGSFKPRNRDPQDSITNAESSKNKYVFNKSFGDLSKESSTIQESLVSFQKNKKGWFEPEENSTVMDSIKKKNDIQGPDASWFRQANSSLQKIINKEYTFDAAPEDDGFDESLLSASLTQLDIPQTFVIPTIFIRKPGESDIAFDVNATRQAIENTLTMGLSDEEVTWGSTINNSIISMEDAALSAAAAKSKEIQFGSSKDSRTPDTGAAIDSLIGSGTSGFTGKTLGLSSINESGVSGLTNSVIMGSKDAFGTTVTDKLSTLAEEIGARARRKMEVIPSEVSSYVEDTLSQNRSAKKEDSEGDDRSSWHHRTSVASTMVSTKKVANKKSKFKPRRSSTSTLPSIGSYIPEETWDYGDDEYIEEDEEEDDDEEEDEDDEDEESIYEIEIDEERSESSVDDIEEAELTGQLSSILEVASRDMTNTNSREFSVSSNKDLETGDGDNDDNGNHSKDSSDESDDDDKSASHRSVLERCVCLDVRCFERNRDGSRGRFRPTMGVYVLVFLFLLLLSVWVGIGVVWYRVRQPE